MKADAGRRLLYTLMLTGAGVGVGFSCFMFGMADAYWPPQVEWQAELQDFLIVLAWASLLSLLPAIFLIWTSKNTCRVLLGWGALALLSQLGWLLCNG